MQLRRTYFRHDQFSGTGDLQNAVIALELAVRHKQRAQAIGITSLNMRKVKDEIAFGRALDKELRLQLGAYSFVELWLLECKDRCVRIGFYFCAHEKYPNID